MMSMAFNDLHFVRSVSGSDVRIIRMACEQLAYTAVKHSKANDGIRITDAHLAMIKQRVDEIGKCWVVGYECAALCSY